MKIKTAIIGFGHIAQKHHQILQSSNLFELVAVADNQKNAFEKNQSVFTNPAIDLVVICTPSGTHHQLAIDALNHQKNVLVEKPMALSSVQCNQMINCAQQNKKSLFVVKQNRFNEPIQQLKMALDQELLGNIFQIQVSGFWNRNEAYYQQSNWRGTKQLDGGILFNQFSHFIDILFFLFGKIVPQHTLLKNYKHPFIEFEDAVSATFLTPSGALGSLQFSTNATNQNMEGSIVVIAEHATLKIGGKYLNHIEYLEVEPLAQQKFNLTQHFKATNNASENKHVDVYQSVYAALNGQKQSALASATEGKIVVEIIEKFYQKASWNH